MASKCGTYSLSCCMICLRMTGAFYLQQTLVFLPFASSLIACCERRIAGDTDVIEWPVSARSRL